MTLDPSMCTERSWPCASMPRPLEGEDWCALAVRCPRRHTGRHAAGARAPGPPTFSRTGGSSAAVRASRRAGRWQASTRSAGCTAGGGPRHRPSCDARRNGGAAALRCEERSSGACASQQQCFIHTCDRHGSAVPSITPSRGSGATTARPCTSTARRSRARQPFPFPGPVPGDPDPDPVPRHKPSPRVTNG